MDSRHSWIVAAAVAIAVAGCSNDAPAPQAQVAPPPTAAPPPPPPSEGERFANAIVDIGGTQSNDAIKITLGGERFAAGGGDFQPGDKIDAIARVLKDHPQARVLVEGFTDSRGGMAVNQRLSAERAESVKQALVERGIDGSRIETAGRGSEQAIASNDTAEGRAQNRRVELTFAAKAGDRLASAPSSAVGG